MDDSIRIITERDRQTVDWLRAHVGAARLEEAARYLTDHAISKPYVSAICRYLRVRPPAFVAGEPIRDHRVGDAYLAKMRGQLASTAAHAPGRRP
ncbi:hypothetical protein [Burkholderia alba]|uniref:hypothetical protein n=1 Tax=Burkholderia alba TaxID=2683677 RepID=UPI002B0524FB|nr:hypothetical protein [Burkholderia alba]